MQTDICLINMPYSSITIPSLALGIIENYIKEYGYSVDSIYANLAFASKIGLVEYEEVVNTFTDCLIGEWTFSKAAFPDAELNDDGFFALFSDLTPEKKQALCNIREQAVLFTEELANEVLAKHPKIVGCSSTFQQNCASLALLRVIKEKSPNTITMMGGANCEGIMGQTLSENFRWVDYVFSGECDEVIGPFIDKLMKEKNIEPRHLPEGFISQAHKSLTQDIGCNSSIPRAHITDMSKVGKPVFDAYFDTLNNLSLDQYISPGLVAETSRGCWWGAKQHCTFCGLNGGAMTHRSKAPEVAVAELDELSAKYNNNNFLIVDNIIPLEYMKTVLPELSESQRDYNIFYETKANLKKHHVEAYAKAGIKWIQPGIEGLHDDFLKVIKKGTTAIQNIAALKWCRTYGVRVTWNLLSEAPREKASWYDEMAEWLPLVTHLHPPLNQMLKICYHRFSPYFNKQEEYGLNLEPTKSYKYVYPLSQEALFNLAYFFKQYSPEEQGMSEINFSFEPPTSAHNKVQQLIEHWSNLWMEGAIPMLYMIDKEDSIIVMDTREIATSFSHTLQGVAADIYRLAAEPIPKDRLIKKVQDKTNGVDTVDIEDNIEWLIENKLMIHLSKCVMALAFMGTETDMPESDSTPEGSIDLAGFINS